MVVTKCPALPEGMRKFAHAPHWANHLAIALLVVATYLHFTGQTDGKGVASDVLDILALDKRVKGAEEMHWFLVRLGLVWFGLQLVPYPYTNYWANHLGTTTRDITNCAFPGFIVFASCYHWSEFGIDDLRLLCLLWGYLLGQWTSAQNVVNGRYPLQCVFWACGFALPIMLCFWTMANIKSPITNFEAVTCKYLYLSGYIIYKSCFGSGTPHQIGATNRSRSKSPRKGSVSPRKGSRLRDRFFSSKS